MNALNRQIRDAARRLGFALCGFAPIEPVAHADFVRQWLADGNAAEHGVPRAWPAPGDSTRG